MTPLLRFFFGFWDDDFRNNIKKTLRNFVLYTSFTWAKNPVFLTSSECHHVDICDFHSSSLEPVLLGAPPSSLGQIIQPQKSIQVGVIPTSSSVVWKICHLIFDNRPDIHAQRDLSFRFA